MGNSKMWLLVAIVGLVTTRVTEGQTEQTCASELQPCLDYLNSTTPPTSCCDPLKKTVETQRQCLCDLYNNPSILKSLGVNVTQALELPQHCGISDNLQRNRQLPLHHHLHLLQEMPLGTLPGWGSLACSCFGLL
ncbi:Bifunctional inhibitor/plant lipid transfer protein/seed storage helical domain [Dillenia turbinata]|uniref:Bifunctional inhibitor/plant lipid transfer protein/seed storage helical domain n=1 Tax=Dillenia turbinata TaxID=194707 RepID=A0AAN8WGN3_9MAGN